MKTEEAGAAAALRDVAQQVRDFFRSYGPKNDLGLLWDIFKSYADQLDAALAVTPKTWLLIRYSDGSTESFCAICIQWYGDITVGAHVAKIEFCAGEPTKCCICRPLGALEGKAT
jgi:hypothetical protein